MMDAISETDRGKALLGPLSCCPMANHSRQQDVFQCGKFRQQKVTLKNKTHFFIPQTRLCGGAAQDFDPARAHSKRLINITSYQLRWLHGNYLSLGSTSHNNHRNW